MHVALAAAAYIPIVTASPGRVSADTKTYLYLDPGKVLSRALTMWDPNVGLGTVTHQTIGYLFPIGPYYWLLDRLGLPDWLAQRIWLASILFVAGAGVLFLARTLDWQGTGPVVAASVYMLSPYVLHYSARISVILLPWAALPWMIGLVDRALRRGGWRHPALFALVVTLVGGVNATALVLAGLGPALWIVFAVARREVPWRQAAGVVARVGTLTTAASLWWLSGLWAQGRYGIEILRYTETVETVARTSLAPEVLRGLGYWFFYGNDKLGPWIEPGVAYTQNAGLILVGFAIPVAALLAAGFTRWAYRGFFVTLVVVGLVIAVGAHPYDAPSPLGEVWKSFATTSTVGLALRSTPRAVPLVNLGLAMLLGAGTTALSARVPRAGLAASVTAVVVAAAGLPPLWTGDLPIGAHLQRPEEVPAYWPAAAHHLDKTGEGTRVLEIPGSDFAAYRWGNTVDPITPYLMDRPYVARELIPYGSAPGADLLNAFDRRLQEGVFEPESLAPVADLMGVGDVVLRSDLQYERYRTPRPRALWRLLSPPPPGLGEPTGFGGRTPNRAGPEFLLLDEVELGLPLDTPHPPRVAAFPVEDAQSIVRTHAAESPLIVAGDGEGIVDAAAAGLLDRRALLYEAALSTDALERELGRSAELVVTDTNRKRARRWGTVRENTGYTEPAGKHVPLRVDPGDNRLEVFPRAGDRSRTVAEIGGVSGVRATRYGNPVSYTAEDRPVNALDGDLLTAWRVGAFADVRGERLLVELQAPVTTDRLRLTQPLSGPRNRFITELSVRLDGGDDIRVTLDDSSRTRAGQTITFPEQSFGTVELEVEATNIGPRPRYDGVSGVGIAEIGIDGVRADEMIRMPTRLLDVAGQRTASLPLHLVMTRLRANPAEPVRTDEEPSMRRRFELPVARRFVLSGSARVNDQTPDETVDSMLRVPRSGGAQFVARSSGRLSGSLVSRASSALDGDRTTAWVPGLGPQEGRWVEVDLPDRRTVDELNLVLVADERHSVPTRITISGDDGSSRVVDVPPVASSSRPGATQPARLTFDPLTTRRLRLTIDAVRPVTVRDYYSEGPIDLPVGIAELGLEGVRRGELRDVVETACRDDLVTVDGRPVPVQVRGVLAAPDGLSVQACGDSNSVELGAGSHELRTAIGRDGGGIDIDRIVLTAPAASPGPAPAPARETKVARPPAEVVSSSRTSYDVSVGAFDRPFWLTLAQSRNDGWRATVDGRSLGSPRLIDGFANGWLIDPSRASGPVTVQLEWTPQRWVWFALVASLFANLACLAIVAGSRGGGASRVPAHPQLRGRWREASPLLPLHAAAIVGAVGVFTAAVATLPVAGVAMALTAVGSTTRGAAIARFVPAIALALAGAYIAGQQLRYDYPAGFEWPTYFSYVHAFAWVAIAVLVGLVLRDRRL